MSFLFSSKKNKKEIVLILDIGSSSVAGAFTEFSLNEDPKILYVKRYPIKFIHKLEGPRFKKEMFKTLEMVVKDLSMQDLSKLGKFSKRKVKKAYCSLASPWFVSQTKKVKLKKGKEIVITEKFLADFFKLEEENLKKLNTSKNSQKKGKLEIIERKLIDIRLNGYKVEEPLGKVANDVELRLFSSMSQSDILDGIEEFVSKHFYLEDFEFNSFTLASFSAVRDMYDRVSDFLLIDVTGEVTDLSVVKSRNVVETMSFPLGKNSLTRTISEKMSISPEEARSLLNLFNIQKLDGKKLEKMSSIMQELKQDWSENFQKAIGSLSNSFSVPKTIFFTADTDVSMWYGEVIKSEEMIQTSMTESPFIVSFINYSSLESYVSFMSKSEKDTFIAVEAIFFNRLFELAH